MLDSKTNKDMSPQLEYNEENFNNLYQNSPVVYITWNKNGNITDLNKYAVELLGWEKDEIINKEFSSTIIAEEDRDFWLKLKKEETKFFSKDFKCQILKSDGTKINCIWNNIKIKNKAEIIFVAKELASNPEHEIEKIKLIKAINKTDNWVIITDKNGVIEYSNTAVKEITGYNKKEIIGQKPSLFKSNKHNKKYYENLWKTIKSGKVFNDIIINKKKNNDTFYSEQTITPIKNQNNEIINYISVGKDITQNEKLRNKIEYISNYDMMFDLPNRRFVKKRLKDLIELNKEKKIAVLVINFNKIKHLNDIYSNVGDEMTFINLVANLINKQIDDKKNCVKIDEKNKLAYLGRDNFALIIDNFSSTNEIYKIVKQILDLFTDTVKYNQETFMLNVQIGASIYPDDSKNAKKLLSNSEVALIDIKNNDYAFFNHEMNNQIKKINKMEAKLNKAIKNDAFLIYYQPYYQGKDQSLYGMEALLRWKDPELGMVYPSEFIPILENSKLIKKVGIIVISKVISSLKKWIKAGYNVVPVSINLSAKQLEDSDHLHKIYQIIVDSGIDHSLINFEITETSAMRDVDHSLKIMKKMKEENFSISIDDFGTGYSSLNYLQKFPLDYLKIDISFIKNMNKSDDGKKIVESIINIAHLLKLKTIAEGVEKEAQVNQLNKLDNDYIQGYYFAYPMPESKVEKYL